MSDQRSSSGGIAATALATAAPAHFEQVFRGEDAQVRQARVFVAETLAAVPGLAASTRDDAVLCASELAANAVRHTASGRTGGTFTVAIEAGPGDRAHVEVIDQGAEDDPAVLLGGIETGRGLWMCASVGVLTYSAAAATGGRRVAVELPRPVGPVAAAAAVVLAHPEDGSDQR